jgi:deazaflavin-dependent oxidoreductase (nitroreductase family)
MSLRTRLAVRIGSVRWMPRLLPFIVGCDAALHALTRQRYGLLDIAGLPNVTLLAKGRRSGVLRATRLLAVPTESGWLIAGSYFGDRRTPQWVFNLRATDTAEVIHRGRRTTVSVVALEGEQRRQAWQALQSVWPNFALYESRTDRAIPVFELDRR